MTEAANYSRPDIDRVPCYVVQGAAIAALSGRSRAYQMSPARIAIIADGARRPHYIEVHTVMSLGTVPQLIEDVAGKMRRAFAALALHDYPLVDGRPPIVPFTGDCDMSSFVRRLEDAGETWPVGELPRAAPPDVSSPYVSSTLALWLSGVADDFARMHSRRDATPEDVDTLIAKLTDYRAALAARDAAPEPRVAEKRA